MSWPLLCGHYIFVIIALHCLLAVLSSNFFVWNFGQLIFSLFHWYQSESLTYGVGVCNLLNSCNWMGFCCLCQVLSIIQWWQASKAYHLLSLCTKIWGTAYAMYDFFLFFLLLLLLSLRNREIKQMKDSMRHGNSFAFLCHDINELEHSNQVNLPRVTVVMPLKGFGEHNLHNWRTQVSLFSIEVLCSTECF